eukprot:gnl/Dysnectes_brevis/4751_a6542_662.p1 GENE.gnl/Dysnectes_brevis/4751_a6542_662~~gnl/Dysnectes_brevis/4751_a6542_662.p1  ORF type:complete len:221 (+),score=36.58 gnl/Dysnectes_brevis/4751_a6542_662:197-859(+)
MEPSSIDSRTDIRLIQRISSLEDRLSISVSQPQFKTISSQFAALQQSVTVLQSTSERLQKILTDQLHALEMVSIKNTIGSKKAESESRSALAEGLRALSEHTQQGIDHVSDTLSSQFTSISEQMDAMNIKMITFNDDVTTLATRVESGEEELKRTEDTLSASSSALSSALAQRIQSLEAAVAEADTRHAQAEEAMRREIHDVKETVVLALTKIGTYFAQM